MPGELGTENKPLSFSQERRLVDNMGLELVRHVLFVRRNTGAVVASAAARSGAEAVSAFVVSSAAFGLGERFRSLLGLTLTLRLAS